MANDHPEEAEAAARMWAYWDYFWGEFKAYPDRKEAAEERRAAVSNVGLGQIGSIRCYRLIAPKKRRKK